MLMRRFDRCDEEISARIVQPNDGVIRLLTHLEPVRSDSVDASIRAVEAVQRMYVNSESLDLDYLGFGRMFDKMPRKRSSNLHKSQYFSSPPSHPRH